MQELISNSHSYLKSAHNNLFLTRKVEKPLPFVSYNCFIINVTSENQFCSTQIPYNLGHA